MEQTIIYINLETQISNLDGCECMKYYIAAPEAREARMKRPRC